MVALIGGFIAGLVHVFSGPDHLAAVAPLAVKQKHGAWKSGLRWGLGHAFGVALLGGILFGLRQVISMELVSDWSERLVGVLLLGIGFWGFRKAFDRRLHSHEHSHEGINHVHFHLHQQGAHLPKEKKDHRHGHAAFGIGTLHGLAGTSHFYALVPALLAKSTETALSYLAGYLVASVLAMATFALAIGFMSQRFSMGSLTAYRGLMCGSSAASVLVGIYWIATTFPQS
jgi:hypothetical protein